jgi:hypothetical protein
MFANAENITEASAHRVGDPLLSLLALQRWESDGGTVPPPRSQDQLQDA